METQRPWGAAALLEQRAVRLLTRGGTCMHEVLLKTAEQQDNSNKEPGVCLCFTFWLSKASHSVGNRNGEKCHHHLA